MTIVSLSVYPSISLLSLRRYFEYHVTQLKPPFERDPEEEVEAFKERQKEFRQQVYAKWAARTITLVRGKHEVPQRTRRRYSYSQTVRGSFALGGFSKCQ